MKKKKRVSHCKTCKTAKRTRAYIRELNLLDSKPLINFRLSIIPTVNYI